MAGSSSRPTPEGIAVKPAGKAPKPVRRTFPGPRGAADSLRVAIDRTAFADLVAHARESLEAEVCGVLAGQICEDDEGPFVHVEAMIRGNAATQAATSVTFTQATWDAIHQTLERDHPKRRIVGWYHTHPGFGVEFSEMDVFIQKNFFPGESQIALVTDPLSGAVAIAVNAEQGIEYLPRFWVDGRDQAAKLPAAAVRPAGDATATSARAGDAASPDLAVALKALEARVSQLVQAHDDQRASFGRFLFTIGFMVAIGIFAIAGYTIFHQYTSRNEPPRLNNFIPVPVQIGDKTVLIGVGVAEWSVPPELNAALIELEKRKQADEEKRAAKEAGGDARQPAGPEASPTPKDKNP